MCADRSISCVKRPAPSAVQIVLENPEGRRFRTGSAPLAEFIRGDVNADTFVDISDAVVNLNFQFLGSAPPSCVKSADTDDSGIVDISDAVTVLNYLFTSGPLPAAPFPDCGLDPVLDTLTCESHACP